MVTAEMGFGRGFRTIYQSRAGILGREASQTSRRRHSRVSVIVLSGLLSLSVFALPLRNAFADGQVLELPQVSSAAVASPATSDDEFAPHEAAHRHKSAHREVADATPPPGVGSLSDYLRERDGDSSSYPASATMAPAAGRYDPNRARIELVNNVILGALALGLFAYEVHAAHRHYRR